MKIIEKDNKIRLQLMDMPTKRMLFDFEIDKENYEELKDHMIYHLNRFRGEESEYIVLKLQKQLDVVKLRNLINELIDGDNSIGIAMKWLDLVEILLKADGSWDKQPCFYNKYVIPKNEITKEMVKNE